MLGIECFRSLGYQRSKLHAIRSASASGSAMLCLSDGACYRPNFGLGEEGPEHHFEVLSFQPFPPKPRTARLCSLVRSARVNVTEVGVGESIFSPA